MGQPTYTEKLLSKMGMNNCNPVSTPADPSNHLVKAAEDDEVVDQPLYQSLIGSLMYLATCTRPDIAYSVGVLARFSSKPNQSHWTAAKRVLRYLKGTSNLGIVFKGDSPDGPAVFSDADWAGDMPGIENPHPVTCSALLEDPCHGGARSRARLPFLPLKWNTWHSQVQLRSVCG